MKLTRACLGLASNGALEVEGFSYPLTYLYDPKTENLNDRTLEIMSRK
jgi:hypothetical protein